MFLFQISVYGVLYRAVGRVLPNCYLGRFGMEGFVKEIVKN